MSKGSSLKMCMVAEFGRYYPRFAPMEWDTAAGQAVVEAAVSKWSQDMHSVEVQQETDEPTFIVL